MKDVFPVKEGQKKSEQGERRCYKYLDRIASQLGVVRSSTNVTAAAKGLVAGFGSFNFKFPNAADEVVHWSCRRLPHNHACIYLDFALDKRAKLWAYYIGKTVRHL